MTRTKGEAQTRARKEWLKVDSVDMSYMIVIPQSPLGNWSRQNEGYSKNVFSS